MSRRGPGRIVVTIAERGPAAAARAALAAAPCADELELRLDLWGRPWLERFERGEGSATAEFRNAVAALGRPIVAALNGPEAFGEFEGPADVRARILARAAAAGAAALDIPCGAGVDAAAAALGAACAALAPREARSVRRVWSRHDAGPVEDLRGRMAELSRAARPGDRLKCVPALATAEQGLDLLLALEDFAGTGARDVDALELAVFGSGAAVGFTRAFAPACGARTVYAAAADPGGRAVPGQIEAGRLRAAWPESFGPETRLFAVLGAAVADSESPALHAAAMRELGLDAVYAAIESDDFEGVMGRIERLPRLAGLSVTAPFKARALERTDPGRTEAAARSCGAANTLWRAGSGAGWQAANTDVEAVHELIGDWMAEAGQADSRRVRVVGAGGAAAAACAAVRAFTPQPANPAQPEATVQLEVAARRPERAAELAARFDAEVVPLGASLDELTVLIHATSAGSLGQPDARPELAVLPEGVALLDAAYRPAGRGPTRLVREARARVDAPVAEGREWLVVQALGQLRRFHGRAPAREVLERALMTRSAHAPGGPARGTRPHIALIGPRAVGKSAVGAALARAWGLRRVDLDEQLVELARSAGAAAAGEAAGDLLARVGEAVFRGFELEALAAVLARDEPTVVATGGGVVAQAEARRLLAGRARCVELWAPSDVLAARIAADPQRRPPLRAGSESAAAEIGELTAERAPLYRELAEHVLAADVESPLPLARRIARELGLLRSAPAPQA